VRFERSELDSFEHRKQADKNTSFKFINGGEGFEDEPEKSSFKRRSYNDDGDEKG